jgi:hypothetical protein
MLPHMRKSTALFEGTQTSSACPSESNYIQMTTIFGDMGKDNRSTRRKPCSIGSLSTINLARTAPESNPVLRGERLSTSGLNHCRISSFRKEWRYLRGPGSVVGIATGYGLEDRIPGEGEIFRTCPDRPWGSPSLLYNGYRVFSEGKERPGRDANPSPPSSAVGHERVELYLYSPYGPYGLYRASMSVQG